jgi:hypothetical protein
MRLNLIIFKHLCQIVTFAIDKTNTSMKASISIQIELTTTLSRLRSGNVLLPCDEIYKITIGTTFIIMKECYVKIRIFLKLQIFKMPTLPRMKTLVI